MSASGQTLSSLNAILREKFLPGMREAFNNETVLLSRLKRNKNVKVSGRSYLYEVQSSRNSGVGARIGTTSDTAGYLPTPGSQSWVTASLTRAHYYGGFKVYGSALAASMRDGTSIDLINKEMIGVKKDMAKIVNQDLFGSGTGIVTTVTTTASSATQTVADSSKLYEGQPIVFADASGVNALARTIESITNSTTIVLTATVDTTTNTLVNVFRAGVTASGGLASEYNNTIVGLDLINDSAGTYAGINRATAGNTYWKATEISGATGLSVDLMNRVINAMRIKAGGKCSLIVTNEVHWRQYGNLIDPSRRWMSTVKTLDGGFPMLEFNGIPVTWDPDCPSGVMHFLDEDVLELLVEEDLSVMDTDGNVLRHVGTGATAEDAYESRYVYRAQLGCPNPGQLAKLTSLPTT